jgi:hypothetical protein
MSGGELQPLLIVWRQKHNKRSLEGQMFARVNSKKSSNVFAELLLIVLGISIALWFEGLAEDLQEQEIEHQYLIGVRDDLQMDIRSLDVIIRGNQERIGQLEQTLAQLPTLHDATPEAQITAIFVPSSYHFFQPANFTYMSMQESGHFRLLSDPGIKRDLLKLMRHYQLIDELQQNFIQALDDGYIPLMMGGFDLVDRHLVDPQLFKNTLFRNFFGFALQDTGQRVIVLKDARSQTSALLEQISAAIE